MGSCSSKKAGVLDQFLYDRSVRQRLQTTCLLRFGRRLGLEDCVELNIRAGVRGVGNWVLGVLRGVLQLLEEVSAFDQTRRFSVEQYTED